MTTAAALEARLVAHEADAFAPDLLAALDENEEFPAEAVRVLDEAGLPAHYVLTPDADVSETVRLLRSVARRDLTVAIAHGKTFLGTVPVWLAGTPEQTADLAGRVRAGSPVCWGLTERDHGADLFASELTATAEDTQQGRSWRLSGEKWLINNATRADLACVLARTDPAGGGRGFSLFLVDKTRLPHGSWRDLPKVRTHGIRGADISGFTLDDAPLPADALVGAEGDGIPVVLTSLQLTRIACGALSLGAADHALRLAREFTTGRELYGRRLADIPHVRRILGQAAAAALTAEAVVLLAARSVHTLPGELSVTSAIAKAFVPTLTQTTLSSLAELLGVRGFLTSPPGGGFAKLERDHRICAIFDGSTAVNRAALLHQLPRLGRKLRRRQADHDAVRATADLTAAPPAFDRERLALLSVTGCSLVQSLPDTAARVRSSATPELTSLLDRLGTELALLEAESTAFVPTAGGLPSTAFTLAERYERLYAAAACLALWDANSALRTGPLGENALWLRACLTTLVGDDENTPSADADSATAQHAPDCGPVNSAAPGPGSGPDLPDTPAPDLFDALAAVLLERTAPEFTLLGAVT
ncbi:MULTISPECIES: acyl-CoA dehydrogenase family protein [unclassified Streptomyces]|uniref:acyl-CoA dehydrogenase family protein n=1 Tax=unclassified Streptomyces TaxID=2593676 RepID=UPI003827CBF9